VVLVSNVVFVFVFVFVFVIAIAIAVFPLIAQPDLLVFGGNPIES
jgi:hypothetical protein